MAEKKAERKRYYREVSPGFSGAVKDAVKAVAEFSAPRSLRGRKQDVDEAVRRRSGQSTDKDNGY